MKTLKLMIALGLGALVSACGAMPDVASRNAPFETIPEQTLSAQTTDSALQFAQSAQGAIRVSEVNVNIPRTLKVSESNVYYPRGDIVWRGDPIGDRYEQIEAIFQSAAYNGTTKTWSVNAPWLWTFSLSGSIQSVNGPARLSAVCITCISL